VVSPCRDEAAFLGRTLASVSAQTLRPYAWVIVDDGSSDATPTLLREHASRHPWVRVVRRDDRGARRVGPGVVDAFYAGYALVAGEAWDYVCKLDMDLDLPPTYFESLIRRMEEDPRLGTVSGMPYASDRDGALVPEDCSPEMSVGMAKLYRRRCFEQVGGLVRGVMWDAIDCHRARLLGWKARAFDDPDTRFRHLRPMGSSERGILTGRARHGSGQRFMGTGLVYATASAVRRLAGRPLVLGGVAMWWGYVRSALRGDPRVEDPEFRSFLRSYQRRMLLRGKRRATTATEEERAAAWDPARVTKWERPEASAPG
jgi:glycosyltransferase involved in cell wall biosynthesis